MEPIIKSINVPDKKYADTYEFDKRKIMVDKGYAAYRFKHTNLFSHNFEMTFPDFDFDFTPFVNVYHRCVGFKNIEALYYSLEYNKKGLSLIIDKSEDLDYIVVDCIVMCHEMSKTITFEPANKVMTEKHFYKLFES